MTAPYDARQIANWFVTRARKDDRTLTMPILLRLCFIAHGWHLEIHEMPLFENRIEAWEYGPVVLDVYYAFKSHDSNVTKTVRVPGSDNRFDSAVEDLLAQVYDIFGNKSPQQLKRYTDPIGGPSDIAMKVGGKFALIPPELVRQAYILKRYRSKEQTDNA